MKGDSIDLGKLKLLFDAADLFNGYLSWEMMKNEVLVFSFEDAFKICLKIEKEIGLGEIIELNELLNANKESQ